MKFFVDSANLVEITAALERGFVSGVTTNPSLLAKEPKTDFEAHIERIIALVKRERDGAHVSVEVFSRDPDEIVAQARRFVERLSYAALSVKVHVGWEELRAIRELSREGISINCTACMSISQALMAAHAGARYVSLFWGRIRDAAAGESYAAERIERYERRALDKDECNPELVVERTRYLIERAGLETEIIAGSIRSALDVRDAALAGAHIVTVPPKFFPDLVSHFKTDEVVEQFFTDFHTWIT